MNFLPGEGSLPPRQGDDRGAEGEGCFGDPGHRHTSGGAEGQAGSAGCAAQPLPAPAPCCPCFWQLETISEWWEGGETSAVGGMRAEAAGQAFCSLPLPLNHAAQKDRERRTKAGSGKPVNESLASS